MSLRRFVAPLLLVAVSASSVEVLFGLESSLSATDVHLVAWESGSGAVSEPSDGDHEDCACLCACLCAGAQLVVATSAAPPPGIHDVREPFATRNHRSPTSPSPRPPHRPPLA